MKKLLLLFAIPILAWSQVTVIQSPTPQFRSFLPSGAPNASGCVYTFLTGTSTPQQTFTDSTGNTPNANPVILDATGSANIWISSAVYRIQVWSFGSGSVGSNCGNGTQLYQVDGVRDTGLNALNGPITIQPTSNGIDIFDLIRATDISASGNFVNFKSAGGSSLFKVDINGNVTAAGTLTALSFIGPFTSVNGVINAAQQSGSDIGAKVNAGFAACTPTVNTCRVQIPTGNYSYTTTINFPVASTGPNSILTCEPGAVLTYTGSGDAVFAFGTGGESAVMGRIEGCKIIGSSSGLNGIHVKAFNSFSISGDTVRGFSTGNGVLNEGGNFISCDNKSEFDSNKVGWMDESTTVSATRFDPIATNLGNCQFQGNTAWGYWTNANPNVASQTSLNSGSNNKPYFFTNGVTSSNVNLAASPTGAVRNAGGTVATFTCSSACGIATNDEVLISGVTDTTFNGFCAATFISSTSFSCANVGTGNATSGTGTSRQITGAAFIQYGGNDAFTNAGFENTATINSPVCMVLIGDNNFAPTGITFTDNTFSSAGGVVNTFCIGNGTGHNILWNKEGGTVTNLINNIGTGTRTLRYCEPSVIAGGVTTIFTGTNNGADNVDLCATQGGSDATTDVNAQGGSLRGYAFNQISGLNQDLTIRDRASGTHVLNFQNTGGTPVASMLDAGGFDRYNGSVTAGQGLPVILGVTSQKAETQAADANVLTVTPPAVAATYRVCVDINVSSATAGVISWTLSWQDPNGNAQSNIAQPLFQFGTAAPNTTFTTSAVSGYTGCSMIDENSATAIVVKWVGGGTSAAKMSATIERLI